MSVSASAKIETPKVNVEVNTPKVEVNVPSVKINTPKVEVNTNLNTGLNVNANAGVNTKLNASSSKQNVSIGLNLQEDLNEEPNSNDLLSESLRSYSVCAKCLSCGNVEQTQTESAISLTNCLFAYFCTNLWCCYMCCKRKDWNYWNVKHSCGSCGKYIDTYSAC